MPLVIPGIPCISVTLLWKKYSSQVAFKSPGGRQNESHKSDTEVMLSLYTVLAQVLNPNLDNVRFPSKQTLYRREQKVASYQRSTFSVANRLQSLKAKYILEQFT